MGTTSGGATPDSNSTSLNTDNDVKVGNDPTQVTETDDVYIDKTTAISTPLIVQATKEEEKDNEYVEPKLNGSQVAVLKWFADNTPEEVNDIWTKRTPKNNAERKKVLAQLRSPGGWHEWLMVSQANIFNQWGCVAKIFDNDYRGDIDKKDEVYFTKFTDNKSNKHGKPGSGSAHNDIIKIIKRAHNVDENALDSEKVLGSEKFAIYKKDLQKWAAGSIEQWEYKPGVPAIRTRLSSGRKLPKGLE